MNPTTLPIALNEFACVFATTSQEFIESFVHQVGVIDPDTPDSRCHPEICAAVWASTRAAFQASLLTPDEQESALQAVITCLLPFWEEHCTSKCACDGDVASRLTKLSGPYLKVHRLGNVIGTANSIVDTLMAKIGVSMASRPLAGRMLSTALAHRIFSDSRRINEYARTGAPAS
jgi:hypothetical protein